MSFFQNVFDAEFRANLFSADRRLQSSYKIPANTNRSDYMFSQEGPFDLTGNTDLTINYAYDPALIGYASLTINISGSDISSTQTNEVVGALNSDATFSDIFLARESSNRVLITSKRNRALFKAYILNTSAETALQFNSKAPVVELPSYFERYSFENRFEYPDLGSHRLVLLNPADPIDSSIISNAGLDPLSPSLDWKLLKGSNDAFWFYKREYTLGQMTSEIKYPAGASEGDLAKKTYYVYDGSDLVSIMETPYVLQSSDLMFPLEVIIMISMQEYKSSKSVKVLIQKLFESRQVAHNVHLQTKSYALHKALNSYYDNILDLTDTFVETYQGQYGIVTGYEKLDVSPLSENEIEDYLKDCATIFSMGRDSMKDSHLKNIMEEIIALVYQTLYKVRFLK